MTNFWLMKSEPEEFSIGDLKRVRREQWDGIRNYQVRNMLRDAMKKGDIALFYHSNAGTQTGVAGVMKIIKEAYPDPTQFDPQSAHPDIRSDPQNPRWLCVDVQYVRTLPRVVTLAELKAEKRLANLPLVRQGNRLSVMPIARAQFDHIIKLAAQ